MPRNSRRVLALHGHPCNRSLHANAPNFKSQRASLHARSVMQRICSMSKNSSMASQLPKTGSSMNSQVGDPTTVPACVLSAAACATSHQLSSSKNCTAQPSDEPQSDTCAPFRKGPSECKPASPKIRCIHPKEGVSIQKPRTDRDFASQASSNVLDHCFIFCCRLRQYPCLTEPIEVFPVRTDEANHREFRQARS